MLSRKNAAVSRRMEKGVEKTRAKPDREWTRIHTNKGGEEQTKIAAEEKRRRNSAKD
jgi:hypothetical protein